MRPLRASAAFPWCAAGRRQQPAKMLNGLATPGQPVRGALAEDFD
jgi:hypothetical protein